jgi:RHS repeat-associated protein
LGSLSRKSVILLTAGLLTASVVPVVPAEAHTAAANPYFSQVGGSLNGSTAGNPAFQVDPVSGRINWDRVTVTCGTQQQWEQYGATVQLHLHGISSTGTRTTGYLDYGGFSYRDASTADCPNTLHIDFLLPLFGEPLGGLGARPWQYPNYELAFIANGGPLIGQQVMTARTVAPPTAPAAPTDLTVVDIEASSLELTWNDTANNESEFEMERSRVNGDWTQAVTLPPIAPNEESFEDDGLSRDQTYYYRIRAKNAVGNSAWSNTASGTTLALTADEVSRSCVLGPPTPGTESSGVIGGCQADPVQSGIGAYVTAVTDLDLPTFGVPLVFARSYSSGDQTSGPLGVGWTHIFEARTTVQADGDVTIRTGGGQKLSFLLRGDGSFRSEWGVRGKLTTSGDTYVYTTPDLVSQTFDADDHLVSVLDRNGNGLILAYNVAGDLVTVTAASGRTLTLAYDTNDRLESVTASDGRDILFDYTAAGLLSSVTDVRGGVTGYAYDTSGRLGTVTDQENHVIVDTTYDAQGRVISQRNGEMDETTFAWDAPTSTATMTDARGNEWKDFYQGLELIRREDPLTGAVEFERDEDLNLTTYTDAEGNTWTMTYDGRGNMLTRTAPPPLSYLEEFAYDADNNLTSYENGRGEVTTYDYDSAGNLSFIHQPGGVDTRFVRDPATALVTEVTDPRGKVTLLDYNSGGNLTGVTKPSGAKTTFDHDAVGRVTHMVDPRGNVTGGTPSVYEWDFAYDPANHLTSTTDPLGNATEWVYALDGTLTSVEDAKSRTTAYGYDDNHRLTSVTAPDSTVTAYAYDPVGNLTSRTDAKTHQTDYTYDDANRLESVELPGGHTWSYAYDANGNLTQVIDANGNSTPGIPGDGISAYAYDEVDRLTGIDYIGSTPDVGFAYDANSNLTSITDQIGTKSYTYDVLDRLTAVTRGSSGFSYGYDLGSNLTSRVYPDGTSVSQTYDDDSRLATVTSGGKTTSYGYDPAGNLLTTTLPSGNGYVESRTYDAAGRLSQLTNAKGAAILSRFTYVRDAVGNPSSITALTGTTTYAYDQQDRLTEACFPLGCAGPLGLDYVRYTYDEVGNRLTEVKPTATTIYSYNNEDRLTSSLKGSVTTTYTHDANGNMAAAGAKTYTYDQANRMSSAVVAGTTYGYSYDGSGIRVSGTGGGAPANYTWDENHPLPMLVRESNSGSSLLRRYIHGHNLISSTTPSAESYYHYDGIGSVSDVTNASGVPQWAYGYEPFGTSRSATKIHPSAPDNPMRFTGEYLDPSGLYHLRARQYDSGLGRFTAVDPVAPLLSDAYVASYIYALNRPTLFTDPSGLAVEQLLNYFGIDGLTAPAICTGLFASANCRPDRIGNPLGSPPVGGNSYNVSVSLGVAEVDYYYNDPIQGRSEHHVAGGVGFGLGAAGFTGPGPVRGGQVCFGGSLVLIIGGSAGWCTETGWYGQAGAGVEVGVDVTGVP